MFAQVSFVNGVENTALATAYYADSSYFRVCLADLPKLKAPLIRSRLWLDPGFDGFDDYSARDPVVVAKGDPKKLRPSEWFDYYKRIPGSVNLADQLFWNKPDQKIVDAFVTRILNDCASHGPSAISVPQLPYVVNVSRNKINKALAKATANWRRSNPWKGKLILPVILSNAHTYHTQRTKRIEQAERCFQESQAEGIWIVDSDLNEEKGSSTCRIRYAELIQFHQELNKKIPTDLKIAGPYWGMNLVLWARGEVTVPAVSVGGYKYFISGKFPFGASNPQMFIMPLRRRMDVDGKLRSWLDDTLKRLGSHSPFYVTFDWYRNRFNDFEDKKFARTYLAENYKQWIDHVTAVNPVGRPLALFQDLASAYALGKSLKDFDISGVQRHPQSIAEPLMLNCL